jgi:hypothetical protein
MSEIRQASLLLLRLVLAFAAMLIAYIVGTTVIGQTNPAMTPEEAGRAGQALLVVSFAGALVLSFLILRSPWHGLKLIGAVIVVHVGVETFMTQIETLYFNRALQIEAAEFSGIVAAGSVRALVFAPLAVLVLGKMKGSARPPEMRRAAVPTRWWKRLAALAGFYVLVYFAFGYLVAWQWEETRLFYSGTTAIKPFFTHFWDLFFKEDPLIVPFQLLRGALWAALALAIVWMLKAKRWEASLAVALTFAVLLAVPLGLFPNPYMPPIVREAHVFELLSSMLVFGGVAGWVLHGSEEVEGATRQSALAPQS